MARRKKTRRIKLPQFKVKALRSLNGHIVKGKIYDAYKETETAYCIENKRGCPVYLAKEFFERIGEEK